jgi:transposase InsO family protein
VVCALAGAAVSAGGEALVLAEGRGVVVSGVEWTVAELRPHVGRVVLRRPDGSQWVTTVRTLVNDAQCRVPHGSVELAHSRGRQPAGLQDLTAGQRALVMLRYAHLMEAETGFRSGDPLRAGPGEPRPGFDPARTTVTQRREAKVAELAALGAQEARMLGLDHVSVRSLCRWAGAVRRFGIAGIISGNWLRATGSHPSVSPEVREAIFAVRAETLLRSRIDMRTREGLVHQYVRERFGAEVRVPSYWTLRRVWEEWFGPDGARQRYVRSAARSPGSGEHVVVHRPGQVVALDTTQMAVLVREEVFGDPVPAHLTIALDLYTHSIVAFRLSLVSEKSVDVAMLLRDVMMPLPMRDGWGEDLEWPYPGVPADVVAEFAGHRVAGLPFFAPETVTTDHGSVFKNHHLVDVQRVIGANILPARVLRPTDKAACERAFGATQSLLLEWLLGFRGVDVADRGADVEGDAVLTLAQMEHLIATWIVTVWQNRQLGEFAPAWDPGGKHSPNTLFAAAMSQGGFALQIPRPELYYELLPVHHVLLDPHRGVKIAGLWYDGQALGGGA